MAWAWRNRVRGRPGWRPAGAADMLRREAGRVESMSGSLANPTVDRVAAGADKLDLTLLIARILLVVIFPISAYYKIMGWPGIVGMLTQQGLPEPLPLVGGGIAVAVEILGAALVIVGLWTRWAAIALILYVAGTSLLAHRFWEFAPPAQFGQMMSFFKNLCMMGGLGMIAVFGPGNYALRPKP
jgi:putative oxidoreductase